ncbi:hypothetical protein BJ684DRAFT_16157 [Piptocephalis cylindrospora]|uniref:Protein kinase domain-containing protein n=1 Tax=Piptocephalis cylindrospora TaxID=1907219 RepID=A0A4P9Y3J7_9FUNG|nr:hypothetical protein BJ684DRAFT_16157 [Piptocephalis cylindrospora]|eukprot:RKP13445.1 hypothetical protein BJ684DRAFT_16157 [Piptocephalis cylindrospora]
MAATTTTIWEELQKNVAILNELSQANEAMLPLKTHLEKLSSLKEGGTEEAVTLLPDINSVIANLTRAAKILMSTELNEVTLGVDKIILSTTTFLQEEKQKGFFTRSLPWNVSSRQDTLSTLRERLDEMDECVDRYRRNLLRLSAGQSLQAKERGYTPKEAFFITSKSAIWKAEESKEKKIRMIKFHRQTTTYQRELHALQTLSSGTSNYIIHMEDMFSSKKDEGTKKEGEGQDLHMIITESYQSTLEMVYSGMKDRPDVNYNRNVLISIIGGLKVCHAHGLVYAGLNPQSVVLKVEGSYDFGIWKLANFEEALPINTPLDTMERVDVDQAVPEMARAIVDGKPLLAQPSWDVFLLGRLLHYISTTKPFWPADLPIKDRLSWLADDTKDIPLDEDIVGGKHTQRAIERLTLKDTKERRSLEGFQKSTYMTGGYNTMDMDDLKKSLSSRPPTEIKNAE